MRITSWLGILVVPALAALASAQTAVSVRILLGATDTVSTTWDGKVDIQGGSLVSLEPWRFEGRDTISGNTFQISTHPLRRFGGAAARGGPTQPVVANGIIVDLSSIAATRLSISTAQGSFQISLDEIPYGQSVTKLDGRVWADRVPATRRVTASAEEEDFPAATLDRAGDIWMAYVVFHHSPNHLRLEVPRTEPVQDFAPWKQPTGGD